MKILHLTLKKKWFDMTDSGEKNEEYREIKEHWVPRFCKLDRPFVLESGSIHYTKVQKAFAFCWGYKSGRVSGIKYLLENGASFKEFDAVLFTNGYSKNAPSMLIECKGIGIGPAKPEWSDNWQGDVFVIKLGNIISKPTLQKF